MGAILSVVVITGSAGLIGSEAALFFAEKGFDVVGIDNDMRAFFFGEGASTRWNLESLKRKTASRYTHYDVDIRDIDAINTIFKTYAQSIELVIHAAAQPSHDWAANDPQIDFAVNANGTLNLLEATRQYAPQAVFIFTSTNKVYGDRPNSLPLIEQPLRWEIEAGTAYENGIREDMMVDHSLHSIFGASKVAADVMTQEYGRYFGLQTVSFRCGCLTGPNHSGAQLHGFLAYLMKCTATETPYTIYGYKGKQVRDNIHSADLVNAFYHFYQNPKVAAVYNMGGGRFSNCSMLEAINICEDITQKKLLYDYSDHNRIGDHIWWISDNTKFSNDFPEWSLIYNIPKTLTEIYENNATRWQK